MGHEGIIPPLSNRVTYYFPIGQNLYFVIQDISLDMAWILSKLNKHVGIILLEITVSKILYLELFVYTKITGKFGRFLQGSLHFDIMYGCLKLVFLNIS